MKWNEYDGTEWTGIDKQDLSPPLNSTYLGWAGALSGKNLLPMREQILSCKSTSPGFRTKL